MEDKINLGNDRNGMPLNITDCRRRADPPKNASGSAGTDSSAELSKRNVKTGSGSCSTVTNFSSRGPRISLIWISDMRSRRSSAAMAFSTPFSCGYRRNTTIGKGGQISSNFIVGVVGPQTSRKSRRRGDPKTTCRHRRHTRVSLFHLHVR